MEPYKRRCIGPDHCMKQGSHPTLVKQQHELKTNFYCISEVKSLSRRRRGHQRMRNLDGITNAMDMNLGKLWAMVGNREACRAVVHGTTKSQI